MNSFIKSIERENGVVVVTRFFSLLTQKLTSYEASVICKKFCSKDELRELASEINNKKQNVKTYKRSSLLKLYEKIKAEDEETAEFELNELFSYLKTRFPFDVRKKLCLNLISKDEIVNYFA